MKFYFRKYITGLAVASMLAGITAGCDYLDVVPPETPDLPDTMKDRQDALDFLYGCYALVSKNHGFNSYGAHESSTDEFVSPLLWGRLGQVTSWNQLSSTKGSNLWIFSLPWELTYENLGICHLFEEILNSSNPKEVTAADRERWLAEIKFLKAYYHFRLLESYGPIPIIDHWYDSSTGKDDIPGRSHYDYCVSRIVDWLDEAARVLPATVETNELGRATSTICKALKSRVLLYAASPLWNGSFPYANWRNTNYETPGYGMELVSHTYSRQKWVDARKACEEAIAFAKGAGRRQLFSLAASETLRESENVALPDIPGVDDEFKKQVLQFRYLQNATETEGNREVIWSVIADPNQWIIWPWDAIPHNLFKQDGGGYAGGSCAQTPLLYAVEHFYTRNGILPKDDSELPSSRWFESAGHADRTDIINLNDKREPRFYACFAFDGDELSSHILNGKPKILDVKSSSAQGYNPGLFNVNNGATGYYMKKFLQPNFTMRLDGSSNMRAMPAQLIRLAELYLNLAECEAELGNTDAALAALNEVRRRAHVRDITSADFRYMSLIDWIRNERFVELFAEGHRYYDVRRWMIAPSVLKSGTREGLNALVLDPTFEEFNTRTKVDQPFMWDDRMYILPVMSSEIYSNPQLVQAPGY